MVASKRYAEPELGPLSLSYFAPMMAVLPLMATEKPKYSKSEPSLGMSFNYCAHEVA